MITGSATNPQLTEQGFKNVFRVVGRDDQQGPAIASYLIANAKPRIVAVIDDASAYGQGLANEVAKTFKVEGIKVLPREIGTNKTTDWKAVLTKVKGERPDAVFYGGMDSTAGPLLKQGRELGIKAVFSFGDGACTEKMKELAGGAAEGLFCSQAGIPPEAASKQFLDAYRKRFNAEPILYAPFTYDAANLLIEAMKKADSTDPVKYLPALQKIDFAGATGRIAFDAKGDRKDAEMTIFTMRAGKLLPIAVIKSGRTIKYEDFLAQSGATGSGGAAKK
jgi:branched-chain amino acid transport system substrate-binding protein